MEKQSNSTLSDHVTPEWLAKATELKQVVLDRFANMPVAERSVRPSPEAWSASEIVEHLIQSEDTIPVLWRERLSTAPSPKVTVKSEILSRMVSFTLARTGVRVPSLPELEPQGGLDLEQLEQRWAEARTALVAALPENPNAPWVLHPAFGPLSSAQMGRIIAAHLGHHLRHWPKVKN